MNDSDPFDDRKPTLRIPCAFFADSRLATAEIFSGSTMMPRWRSCIYGCRKLPAAQMPIMDRGD
jgi:hypothetical protein